MKSLTGIGALAVACCAGLPLLAAAIASAAVSLLAGIAAGVAVAAAIIAVGVARQRMRHQSRAGAKRE